MSIYFVFFILLIVSLPSFSIRRQLSSFLGANGCILVLKTELGSCFGYEFGTTEPPKKSKRTKKKSYKRQKKQEKQEDDALILRLPYDEEIKGAEKLELSLADIPEDFDIDALDSALGLNKKHKAIESSFGNKDEWAPHRTKKHKKNKKRESGEDAEEGSNIGLDLNIDFEEE